MFAGVNGDIKSYGYYVADNVTGILGRAPWLALRNALLSSELARERRELRLVYVSDESETARNEADDMQKFQWAPILLVGARAAPTFDEWKAEIARVQADADAILIGSYRQLAARKGERALVDMRDVVKWTEANSPLPLIGFKRIASVWPSSFWISFPAATVQTRAVMPRLPVTTSDPFGLKRATLSESRWPDSSYSVRRSDENEIRAELPAPAARSRLPSGLKDTVLTAPA